MKLLSFAIGSYQTYGAVKGDGVVDLGRRFRSPYPTLRDAIAANALHSLRDTVEKVAADYPLSRLRYLIPVTNPEKIICVGVNYANRNEEYRDGSEAPKYASLFTRTIGSLVGHNEPLLRPPESIQFDYEGEIALVIGKGGRRIPKEQAHSHIFGLSCVNEGTVRDWTRHGKFNVTQGKNFDRSGSFGPWLVTSDEFSDFGKLEVSTFVNGERRQHDTTANLMFGFDDLIAYISTFTTLKPGDVISTGTPTGAGVRFDPPIWLKAGDKVEVTASGIGTLSNTVADEL